MPGPRRRLTVLLALIQYAGSDLRSGSVLGPHQGGQCVRGCRGHDLPRRSLASKLAALRGGGDLGEDEESSAEMSSGFENERAMVVPRRIPSLHAAAEQGRALALADPTKPLSIEVRSKCWDQAGNWGCEGSDVTVVKFAAAQWHVRTAEGVDLRGPLELEEGSSGVIHRLRWGWRITTLSGPEVGINVLGGPWLLRQCKLRCCDTMVVQARGTANLTLEDCFVGGEGHVDTADGPSEAGDGLNVGGHAHVLATDCTFQVRAPARRLYMKRESN